MEIPKETKDDFKKHVIGVWSVFALIVLLLIFYEKKSSEKEKNNFYFNDDCKIIKMGNDCSLTQDKFHTPQLCNIILIQRLKDTTLFAQLNTCDRDRLIHVDDKWLYEHEPGDTIHFDYIRKDRFFTINKHK